MGAIELMHWSAIVSECRALFEGGRLCSVAGGWYRRTKVGIVVVRRLGIYRHGHNAVDEKWRLYGQRQVRRS